MKGIQSKAKFTSYIYTIEIHKVELCILLVLSLSPYTFRFLHRLISAYRDKIERSHEIIRNSTDMINPTKDWYFKTYGYEMVRRYRKKYIEKFGIKSLTQE